ncbi:hypothetical protein ZIOFF_014630 [Zingiber officinale]|uniref:Cytokinin riboside 5'-monophosphate phosphoribohydrolase n=1 Tax=Zingiber officinale TaxID=94328 RepID=A0A8J5HB59_ZINOF|nr:hypothetical protein ZIOFF_014630 [Zingiber officinale]
MREMGDETGSEFKRICVFCGSNSGNRTVFSDAAVELGRQLFLMVDAMVIPKALVPIEISGETVGEVKVVSNMHERKAVMAGQADAFIALPGGYGTMEEVMEMITWSQLGIHNKPVGLLNVDGYYNSLLELFDNGVREGFIKPASRHIVISSPNATELLAKMELYTPLHQEVVPRQSWEVVNL